MENQNSSPYLIPGAIVIAGLLIAVAVYLGGGTKPKNNQNQNDRDIIAELGINQEELDACNASGRYTELINEHIQDALNSGGAGTPYNVVVLPNGQKAPVNGAQPYGTMKQIVDTVLSLPEGGELDISEIDTTDVEKVAAITENDHLRGSPNAKMTFIEFSDLECPFCATFHTTMEQIMSEHEANGEVAWVYRHFPLESIHPNARNLAHTSECVAELAGEDAFWEYVSYVFQAQ